MSTIFSITGTSSNSFIDSCLGTSSSSSSSSTSSLIDYSLIKSGAYKKLMTAYYANEDSSSTSTAETKENLETTQSDAKTLATKSSALSKTTFSEDNRENILKNVKSYVSAYNDLLSSTDDVDDTSVLRNTLWITQQTEANESLLSEVGITIGENNELEVDEDTLNSASLTTLQSLFTGSNSYLSYVTTKSAQTYAAAASALNNTGSGSAYTSSGSYSSLTTGSIIDSIT